MRFTITPAAICVILCSVAILTLLPVQTHGITNHYIEDFSTKQYCDTLNTTAWWDTIAGELKLHEFTYEIVGTYDTPGIAWGIYVSGDYAFIADSQNGLHLMDITDPTNPVLLGTADTPGYARDVYVDGNYAFVADDGMGFQAIDISDPYNPVIRGWVDLFDSRGICVSGDYAYVADRVGGLRVIDISDPQTPTLAATCYTPGISYGVAVAGNYAYVCDEAAGLQVIDISDPTSPTLVGTYDTPGQALDVNISGNYAYVADWDLGLQVIDITDPTSPSLAGSYNTPGKALGLYVDGDYAYIADELAGGLQIIDISDPSNPTPIDYCDTPDAARSVHVSGEYAYVADCASGLQVIDISNTAIPTYAGSYDSPDYARDVVVSGDYAYVADGSSGLQVIDISDPSVPSYAGSYDTPGTAHGVAISGDFAYVADGSSGLQVIDISDPTVPTYAGSYDTPGSANGVAISGDYAYVADQDFGLQVIDISDPTVPTYASSYDIPASAHGVAISGDYAYVAIDTGLFIIDIGDPTALSMAGYYFYGVYSYCVDVAISGDYAYVTDYYFGLHVVNISDPTNPTYVGIYYTADHSQAVSVSGDHLYLGIAGSGILVFDISVPTNPTLISTCDTPGEAVGVAISGDYAYVADSSSGLQVIQVFQHEVVLDNNVGWSLAVDASKDTILCARLTTTQTTTVTWELSGNGGVSWEEIEPDGSWNQLVVPGADLLWRSTHVWTPGINPTVMQLEIGWLYEAALIDSIVDVPDDQGRSVSISFTRSGYDFLDETEYPIVGYAIYRRLDDPLLVQQVKSQPSVPEKELLDHPQLTSFDPDAVRKLEDRTFIVGSEESSVSTLPPGVWEGVGWVLPTQTDTYTARVNTLVDSTASEPGWTVFVTAVHTSTPSVWYVSEPDSGYSVDNIAPGVPEGLIVAYNTGSGNQLTWDPSPEPDFQYYRIYRGDSEDFTPGPGNLVHETATEAWADPEYDGWNVYYKITALDYVGNESEAASPTTVTGDETPSVPKAFALHQNVPNPFNPSTMIRFDMPRSAHVKLTIYNVKGELVATLVDEYMTEGCKEVGWEAKDNEGRSVASGIYFYRLTAGDFVQTKKMVLLR